MKRSHATREGRRVSFCERCLGGALAASLLLAGGCAHSQNEKGGEPASEAQVEKLHSRIKELEETNGRLSKRLDQMEDDIFLLQDRVEAHRLALQRRGRMQNRTGDDAQAKAPRPTPQTNYGSPQGSGKYRVRGYNTGQFRGPRRRRGEAKHPVTRIPLSEQQAYAGTDRGRQANRRSGSSAQRDRSRGSDTNTKRDRARSSGAKREAAKQRPASERQEPNHSEASPESGSQAGSSSEKESEETLVVTNEDFQEFARSTGGGEAGPETSKASGESGKQPKKRVTEEKLSTTDQLQKRSAGQRPTGSNESGAEFQDKSGLDLYKAALAKYRSGDYETALEGFERFLASGPRRDYRDNGLYWTGECYYGLGEYERAIEQFKRVLDEQPDGNKVPDAMLKMALALQELGRNAQARKRLETLVRQYPSTNAGRLGEKKLSDLES